LMLMLLAYMRVAIGDPRLMVALARQSDWWLILAGHPQPFARVEPGIWTQLAFDTLPDRLIAGWYYLGFGWYAGLLSGTAIVWASLSMRKCRVRLREGCIVIAIAIAIISHFLIGPLLAQRQFALAVRCEASGDLRVARENYRDAIRLDPWFNLNSRF